MDPRRAQLLANSDALNAMRLARQDVHRVIDVIRESDDTEDARRRLADLLGVSPDAAMSVLDQQWLILTKAVSANLERLAAENASALSES